MSLRVDPDELDRAAKAYNDAAVATSSIADTFPTTIDAGLATPALTAMLAEIARSVAGLVQTFDSTGVLLAESADAYRRKDDEAVELLVDIWTP